MILYLCEKYTLYILHIKYIIIYILNGYTDIHFKTLASPSHRGGCIFCEKVHLSMPGVNAKLQAEIYWRMQMIG